MPTTKDLQQLLNYGDKNRGFTVELPFKTNNIDYTLTVRVERNADLDRRFRNEEYAPDPFWALYQSGSPDSLWSSALGDVELVHDVLFLTLPSDVVRAESLSQSYNDLGIVRPAAAAGSGAPAQSPISPPPFPPPPIPLGPYPSGQAPYPAQQGHYPGQYPYGPYPQNPYQSYPPQQSPYPAQQSPYPAQQAPYPPQQGSYPPQQGPYPPQQGPYPPQQSAYPPQQGPYPPSQAPYPSQPGAYPPHPQGYPQTPYPAQPPQSYPSQGAYPAQTPYPYAHQAPYPGQQPHPYPHHDSTVPSQASQGSNPQQGPYPDGQQGTAQPGHDPYAPQPPVPDVPPDQVKAEAPSHPVPAGGGGSPSKVATGDGARASESSSAKRHGEEAPRRPNVPLGDFLVKSGLIPDTTLSSALKLQELVNSGALSISHAAEAVRRAHARGVAVDANVFSASAIVPEGPRRKPLPTPLGEILVEAGLVSPSVVRSALNLQEVVRTGAVSEDQALESFISQHFGAGKKPREEQVGVDEEIVALLERSGLLSLSDLNAARTIKKKHGGKLAAILISAGKLDKMTFEAARQCKSLIEEDRMKPEQAIIALHYCQRSRLTLDEAFDELGWDKP